MAVLPRLEMRFVRGSPASREIGIVMRTTAVEVPPYLLGPAMLASWVGLAPFLLFQSAFAACASAGLAPPVAGRPASPEPLSGAPAQGRPAAAPAASQPKGAPTSAPPQDGSNVVRFPDRAHRR